MSRHVNEPFEIRAVPVPGTRPPVEPTDRQRRFQPSAQRSEEERQRRARERAIAAWLHSLTR